ncbi:MAG TPA: dihydrolipoamide acetyltransferase family protein [Gemmatimonadales bacterium]|nr:dihydrolipoamide acetyltransferase family protein [Gemmatimonadales bacterium]
MPTKVVMEALSPTMEEGRLVEWKKAEGDAVAVGDVLAEVETDKAVMELVARADGILLKQVVAAGDTVPVAEPVGWIGAAGEEIPGGGGPSTSTAPVRAQPAEPGPAAPSDAAPAPATPAAPAAPAAPVRAAGDRIKASPVARRIAGDRGLDLAAISGTGPEGRIIKRDVDAAVAQPAAHTPALAGAPGEAYTDLSLSQMRKAIARRLVQSIGPIPTFYLTAEVDMERAAEARQALLARDPEGRFSFNDIIIRATAAALTSHPFVNAWWLDDRIRQWQDVHIGVAVAIDEGLITPVIRHADRKGLREISAEVRELAGRARTKRLQPEEYTGATFTISNLGMFGIDDFTAIINPPEAGILAVGRIEPKAVVVDGAVTVRQRMRITLSCDHRVIDGATGAQFLQTLVGMLENPLALVW